MTVTIRARRDDDLPALGRALVEQQPASGYPHRAPLPMPAEDFIARPGTLSAWTAEIDGAPVGHVAALPVLDEPAPAAWGIYVHEHTRRWAETIRAYDGYVFVLTEYNHGVPGPLKNALDYLYDEWSDKSVGFVSYGLHGGIRAVEQMRTIAAEFKLADVRDQVSLSIYEDFDFEGLDMGDPTVTGRLAPRDFHLDDLSATLHGVVVWAEAMASLRVTVPA